MAIRRIHPLVCSHPFLGNYLDKRKDGLTRTPRVHFSVLGEQKELKVGYWRLAFCFSKNKADLCVLVKFIYCTPLSNWHPHMGNKESTWRTRPHIHLPSTRTQHTEEASLNSADNRGTPSN